GATIPDIHGVEMERCGAGASMRLGQVRRAVGVLMIRGISDEPSSLDADRSGSPSRAAWKEYATSAAAGLAEELVKRVSAGLQVGETDEQNPESVLWKSYCRLVAKVRTMGAATSGLRRPSHSPRRLYDLY